MKKLAQLLITTSLVSAGLLPAIANAEPSAVSPQMLRHAEEGKGKNTTAQVTAVSQLSDIQPTDWAFTALQSLVERYGCIAGYPDKTYRGQRALTRFEFAAGLNACLNKVSELLASGLADKVGKEDLAALQRLQQEFTSELATIKGRVDALELKTTQLEAQQFSTTTKLQGEVIGAISGAGSGTGDILSPNGTLSGNPGSSNTTAIARVRLELNTSFTGDDLLLTRLETGNGGQTIATSLDSGGFSALTGFANSSNLNYTGAGTGVTLGILRYDFSPIKNLRISVGPVIELSDHIDINSYANDEAVDFSTNMFINNPLLLPLDTGAGVALDFNPGGGPVSVRLGYVAGAGSFPTGDGVTNRGLTGDPYQATAEVEFAPKGSNLAARLQYTRASVNNFDYSIGGINLEWAINSRIALFGRYGFGNIDNRGGLVSTSTLANYVSLDSTLTNLNPSTWSAGIAFPDLIRPGATGAIAVGQPFIEGNVGNSTQTNIEAFYSLPLTENIRITPDLQFIINPNNNSSNSLITIGTLRTVFSF